MEILNEQRQELIELLKHRFELSMHRHEGVLWDTVVCLLDAQPRVLETVFKMEESGGEPDIIYNLLGNEDLCYVDLSPETPNRRSLCYDQDAWDARKKNKPISNVMKEAQSIGITLLDEIQYRTLQEIEPFDLKTSTWIHTPSPIREKGGALFCDRRYDTVFVYHNGADSYYASRGFRGYVRIDT